MWHHTKFDGKTAAQWIIDKLAAFDGGNECLVWPFAETGDGYAFVFFRGKKTLHHRFAFFVIHGKMPTECVLHRCDNRRCFSPNHLFEGTRIDNNADMRSKGRMACGNMYPQAKLNPKVVRQIRELIASKSLSRSAISKEFGIDESTVYRIGARKAWAHVE